MTMRRAFCVLIIVVLGATAHQRSAGQSDLLWRVYARGPEEKRQLLRQSYQHLFRLRSAAEEGKPASEWTTSTAAHWLLNHRLPASLAVQKELSDPPTGPYLEVLVHLAEVLGDRSLTRRLPELLEGAWSHSTRSRILLALARSRGEASLAALKRFIESADDSTPEPQICTAAHGLGLSGREEYLPVLQQVQNLVKTREGRLRLIAARYFCGDENLIGVLQDVLRDSDGPGDLQEFALRFFARARHQESVEVLAHYAARTENDRRGYLALDALRATTAYALPPAEGIDPTAYTESPAEQTPAAGGARRPGLERKQRSQRVKAIMRWWKQHKIQAKASDAEAERKAPPSGTGGRGELPH